MVRLTTRVETIRELLEKFLDDDEDMHDMNLTARQQDILERHESLIRNNMVRNSLQGENPAFTSSSSPCLPCMTYFKHLFVECMT